jgi:hypothetical protein
MIIPLSRWYILAAPSGHACANWKSLGWVSWKTCASTCMQWGRRPLEAKQRHTSVTSRLIDLMPGFGALDNAAVLPRARCAFYFGGRYPEAMGRIQSLATSFRNGGSLKMSTHVFLLNPTGQLLFPVWSY